MAKTIISTPEVAKPPALFSMATKSGELVFVAGVVATDVDGEIVRENDIRVQTRQVIENIKAIVTAAGGSLSDITKTTVYITDFANYAGMNEVYLEYFANEPPARATVRVDLFSDRLLVEIDAIAVVSSS